MESDFTGPRSLSMARQNFAVRLRFVSLASLAVLVLLYAAGVNLALWFYPLVIFISRYCWIVSTEKLSESRRAEQGANGEDEVARVLKELPEGWSCMRNLIVQGVGDVDFLITSPSKQYFVIDVKSHAGLVTSKDGVLLRQMNGAQRLFEKDILAQCMKQAIAVRENGKLPFVRALIVFSQATLALEDRKLRGVCLLQKNELVEFLQSADRVSSQSKQNR